MPLTNSNLLILGLSICAMIVAVILYFNLETDEEVANTYGMTGNGTVGIILVYALGIPGLLGVFYSMYNAMENEPKKMVGANDYGF
jgi:hypothetical protein